LLCLKRTKNTNTKTLAENPRAGEYSAGSPKWNNPNLVGALFKALDRQSMVQTIFQGQAAITGNNIQPQAAFAIQEKELVTFPGYISDRSKDEAEAKQM